MSRRPLRVAIVSPGLGIAERGFERLARDCFDALSGQPDIEATLLKGRGARAPRDLTVRTLPRTNRLARSAAHRTGREPFWLEQMSFALAVQPRFARLRPDVVLLSEWSLARALARIRTATRARFRILLVNGAAGGPPFPPGVDHVAHPVPSLLERAQAAGEPAGRHSLLPHGVKIDLAWAPPSDAERADLRRRLGLPQEQSIVLSVGSISAAFKRMDFVVEELARLPAPRPFLVLLGAAAEDTAAILDLGRARLGDTGFVARSVPADEVASFYRAADAVALASQSEGFGLAGVEALAEGLPVVAHDYEVTRFVIGDHGDLADLREPGSLAGRLADARLWARDAGEAARRHAAVYERFSWDLLAPAYAQLLRDVAVGQRSA